MKKLKLDVNNVNLITLSEGSNSFLSMALVPTDAVTQTYYYPLYKVRYSRLPLLGSVPISGRFNGLVYKKHNTSYIAFIKRLLSEYSENNPYDVKPFVNKDYTTKPYGITCTIASSSTGCFALALNPCNYVSESGKRPYSIACIRRPKINYDAVSVGINNKIYYDEERGFMPLVLSGLSYYAKEYPYDTEYFYD